METRDEELQMAERPCPSHLRASRKASEKGNAPDAKNRINRHHNDIGHSTSTIMGSAIVASYKGSTTILVMGIPTLR